MSDLAFVEAALRSLEALIAACNDFDEADGATPHDLATSMARLQTLRTRAHEFARFATSRLDKLAARYHLSPPGEWAARLVDRVWNYTPINGIDEYRAAMRGRRYELGVLAQLLKNDLAAADPRTPPLATPASPEPPAGLIDEAKRDVALYLARLPRPGPDTDVNMNAQTLACGVRDFCKCPLPAAEWAIFRLTADGLLEVVRVLPEAVSSFVPLSRLIVRATDAFWRWWREGTGRPGTIGARVGGASNDPAGAGHGEGGGKKKRHGGRPALEVSDPHKFQVYERIRGAHEPNTQHRDTVDRLKADRQFAEQVREAGLKLNTKLVRVALAYFDQRARSEARKKQETDPA
jgi:hypothetical protein